jgi:hypothetical protein
MTGGDGQQNKMGPQKDSNICVHRKTGDRIPS